ncbi:MULTISPECIES: hypothetical protein [Sphingomonadaceae]|jgi:hypothetical protein|uniref:Uncharacterized protein n=1 Tax=Sphingobium cloacae TaxID=120107 RepID=A0A1E1F7J8_9SPHN|nr:MULTISPECIES: hypothetical protein [Sphingomonadaceae]OJU23366.1 MAG: hypothetical protein BGN95_24480 [Sphingomonas sp. 66-10]RSU88642.1 hypothetical protein CA256_21080 [Sphingomonas koreensis]RSV42642.1 hypothetical protein CA233_17395 [Sphingomonas sp. ABOLD]BAV66490.1 hypothetical protein SCLO_2001570 [Sphingobium cloacae]
MLVARAQLDFIRDLVARFQQDDSMMRPVADFESQYVAIVALLRSVGHVFANVDCHDAARREYSREQWPIWRRDPIFSEFIEPTRNALLKEFQGGLELRSEGFGTIAVVVDPTMPGNVAHVAAFNAREVRDRLGRPVLPNFHAAIAFWDRCLSQAETAFGEAPTLRS